MEFGHTRKSRLHQFKVRLVHGFKNVCVQLFSKQRKDIWVDEELES